MIKRLKIKNFQSYYGETVIEFAQGVNAIVGDGDQGKSAMLRALEWVLRNESPSTWWNLEAQAANENAVVGIILDSPNGEIKVIRERGKTKNQYRLYEPGDTEAQEFTGFGVEIPEKIRRIFGHEPIRFTKDLSLDLNFSGQHDDPFLMKRTSPRQLAQVLGKLTGIDVLDQAENLGQKEVKSLKGRAKTLTGEQERLTAEISGFPDLESTERQLTEISTHRKALDKNSQRIDGIEDTTGRIQALTETCQKAETTLGSLESSIGPANTSIEHLRADYKRLSGVTRDLEHLRDQRDRLTEAKRQSSALSDTPQLIENASTCNDTITKISRLTQHIDGLRQKTVDLETKSAALARAEEEVQEIATALAEQIESTEVCPLSSGTLFEDCKGLLKRV